MGRRKKPRILTSEDESSNNTNTISNNETNNNTLGILIQTPDKENDKNEEGKYFDRGMV